MGETEVRGKVEEEITWKGERWTESEVQQGQGGGGGEHGAKGWGEGVRGCVWGALLFLRIVFGQPVKAPTFNHCFL